MMFEAVPPDLGPSLWTFCGRFAKSWSRLLSLADGSGHKVAYWGSHDSSYNIYVQKTDTHIIYAKLIKIIYMQWIIYEGPIFICLKLETEHCWVNCGNLVQANRRPLMGNVAIGTTFPSRQTRLDEWIWWRNDKCKTIEDHKGKHYADLCRLFCS